MHAIPLNFRAFFCSFILSFATCFLQFHFFISEKANFKKRAITMSRKMWLLDINRWRRESLDSAPLPPLPLLLAIIAFLMVLCYILYLLLSLSLLFFLSLCLLLRMALFGSLWWQKAKVFCGFYFIFLTSYWCFFLPYRKRSNFPSHLIYFSHFSLWCFVSTLFCSLCLQTFQWHNKVWGKNKWLFIERLKVLTYFKNSKWFFLLWLLIQIWLKIVKKTTNHLASINWRENY